jgi:pimeloyl-ACP methyl ester carboxylesterase
MNPFTSFDGIRIAYDDQGEGPPVVLLHGGYADGLNQFGDFERVLPLLEKRQEMFRQFFGERFLFPILPSREGLA